MKNEFNSYEEISSQFPINGEVNFYYKVDLRRECCLNSNDRKFLEEKHPNGWFDSVENRWYYWNILPSLLYDSYIFNEGKWYLAYDNWDEDGFFRINIPKFGAKTDYRGNRYGVFKTLKEAEDFVKYELEHRLDF